MLLINLLQNLLSKEKKKNNIGKRNCMSLNGKEYWRCHLANYHAEVNMCTAVPLNLLSMCLRVFSMNSLSSFTKAGQCLAAFVKTISSYSVCMESLHLLRFLLSVAFKIFTILVQMFWSGVLKFSCISSCFNLLPTWPLIRNPISNCFYFILFYLLWLFSNGIILSI